MKTAGAIEEFASSLDEMFMMLAEQADMIEVLKKQMEERDKMNLLMVKHVERLVSEKDFLMRCVGLISSVKAANELK